MILRDMEIISATANVWLRGKYFFPLGLTFVSDFFYT